jgi:hypothetical protein
MVKCPFPSRSAEGVHCAHVRRGRDGEADGAGAAAAGRGLRRVILYTHTHTAGRGQRPVI